MYISSREGRRRRQREKERRTRETEGGTKLRTNDGCLLAIVTTAIRELMKDMTIVKKKEIFHYSLFTFSSSI